MQAKQETRFQAPAVPTGFNPEHMAVVMTGRGPAGRPEHRDPQEPWARLSGMRETGGDAA